mmetsp:Transcript_79511/g.233742  ORF Transcript_79511/g.233742 Transcript_79511/m.233742 type:complete len:232 (-) Transcript_79511:490-1185(-)
MRRSGSTDGPPRAGGDSWGRTIPTHWTQPTTWRSSSITAGSWPRRRCCFVKSWPVVSRPSGLITTVHWIAWNAWWKCWSRGVPRTLTATTAVKRSASASASACSRAARAPWAESIQTRSAPPCCSWKRFPPSRGPEPKWSMQLIAMLSSGMNKRWVWTTPRRSNSPWTSQRGWQAGGRSPGPKRCSEVHTQLRNEQAGQHPQQPLGMMMSLRWSLPMWGDWPRLSHSSVGP